LLVFIRVSLSKLSYLFFELSVLRAEEGDALAHFLELRLLLHAALLRGLAVLLEPDNVLIYTLFKTNALTSFRVAGMSRRSRPPLGRPWLPLS